MGTSGSYLIQTAAILLGVVALAVAVIYGARRMGIGSAGGPLRLLGRLPLEPRRSVYLVQVGERVFVVGSSESGLAALGEMTADEVPAVPEIPTGSGNFAALLANARRNTPELPGSEPLKRAKKTGSEDSK